MRIYFLYIVLLQCLLNSFAYAEQQPEQVQIADPFLEMHTGAAASFPIFHVVERDAWIKIIKRRTDWYKIRTSKDIEGWVHRAQMSETLTPTGEKMLIIDITHENYLEHKWETGMMGGNFEGSTMLSIYSDYQLTQNLATEISLSQILGNFSSRTMLNTNLIHQPFPDVKLSPYFLLGTGIVNTSVRSTQVQLPDKTDFLAHYGFGFKMYLTRRFVLRIDYKKHIIFQSRNDNEVIESWQLGFAFFF